MMTRLRLIACVSLLLSAVTTPAAETRLVAQTAHSEGLLAVAFSPDGKLAATASADHSIKVWHVATGDELYTMSGFNDEVTGVAFSPDGKLLVGVSKDEVIRVANAADGHFLFHIAPKIGPLRAVAISPDSTHIAAGSDGFVAVWKVAGGIVGNTRRMETGAAHSLAFHPKGHLLAAAGTDATVQIVQVKDGKRTQTFKGHTKRLTAVAYSPDGELLASAGEDGTVRIWNADTGKPVCPPLKGHEGKVNAVCFSLDGKTVISGGEDKTIRFWDAADGTPRGQGEHTAHPVSALAMSPTGKMFLAATRHHADSRLWHTNADGTEVKRGRALHGALERAYSISVAPDGKSLAIGMDRTIALWRLGTAHQLQSLSVGDHRALAVAFSPDGRLLASGSSGGGVALWDTRSGKFLHSVFHQDVRALAFSPDGKTLATTGLDRAVQLWKVNGTKLIRGDVLVSGKTGAEQFYAVAYSPDGKVLAAGTVGAVRRWDTTTNKELPILKGHAARYYAVAFSPDGNLLAGGCQDGSIKLWALPEGRVARTLTTTQSPEHYWPGCIQAVAFHPNGKVLASGSNNRVVRLWDVDSGKQIGEPLRYHGHTVKAVAFSKDGEYFISGSGDGFETGHGDGMVKLWSFPKEGAAPKVICTLVAFADGTWAVVDPKARYDASNGGDVPWLHFVVGTEPIALSQLKDRYYEPRLLDKLLGFNHEPLRDVKKLDDLKPAPAIVVAAVGPKKKQLAVKVSDSGGGIGRVQVLVNGKEVVDAARIDKVDPKTGETEVQVDLTKTGLLLGKGDKVRVVAWNKDGDLAGRGLSRELDDDPALVQNDRELHAIVVGVSTYKHRRLNLLYPSHDAERIAEALEKGGTKLFGANKVHLTLLTSNAAKPEQLPTKENIEKAFAAARKARPQDIFVIFMAGHGLALPEDDLYCYLTADAANFERTAYADAKVRQETTVTSEELAEWIKQVPALKQVMILDTCAAGAAAIKLTARADVSGRQIRAIDRLKDRTGFHVLMGCAADKVSYEASQYEQGLLTYALLQGLHGAALDEKQQVQVDRLFRYAADRVPELARDVGGIQQPHVNSQESDALLVGKLAAGDLPPLPQPKPFLLKPRLLDPSVGDDHLKLVALLRERLGKAAAGAGRRTLAVYVDADEMTDAIRPAGTYSVNGTDVSVKLVLRKNNTTLGKEITIPGKTSDLPDLADRIAAAVVEAARKKP